MSGTIVVMCMCVCVCVCVCAAAEVSPSPLGERAVGVIWWAIRLRFVDHRGAHKKQQSNRRKWTLLLAAQKTLARSRTAVGVCDKRKWSFCGGDLQRARSSVCSRAKQVNSGGLDNNNLAKLTSQARRGSGGGSIGSVFCIQEHISS